MQHKSQTGNLTIVSSSTDEWCMNRHSFADLEHFPHVKSLQIVLNFESSTPIDLSSCLQRRGEKGSNQNYSTHRKKNFDLIL